ncbi:MAG: hypothetical protein JWR83_588 [Aeromicrobium sp.]|nr:hypothetical protein [Aeromicrobium sp.]
MRVPQRARSCDVRARGWLAGVAVLLSACHGGLSSGSLSTSQWDSSIGIGHPTDVGSTVGFGGPMMLINASHGDATIDDVSLQHVDNGLTLVGWVLYDVGDSIPYLEPFPPVGARAASWRVVGPSRNRRNDTGVLLGDVELVVGIKINSPGELSAQGVRVSYTDANGHHTILFPLKMFICAPRADYPGGCSAAQTN